MGLCVVRVLVMCGVVVSLDSRARTFLLPAALSVLGLPLQVVAVPATSRKLVLTAPKRAVLVGPSDEGRGGG